MIDKATQRFVAEEVERILYGLRLASDQLFDIMTAEARPTSEQIVAAVSEYEAAAKTNYQDSLRLAFRVGCTDAIRASAVVRGGKPHDDR